ncbi:hypothetical protein [Raoultibacter timonensis]|uniref:hypothetical protein n=1 Tax=Raoultibacter timonensis TaxID=1907662 RepID=UPI0026DAD73F|nr:hypothetical protein [Raoultibacter timonensis]
MKAKVSRKGFFSMALAGALVIALGVLPAVAYAVSGSYIYFTAGGVSCQANAVCAASSGGGAFGRVTVSSSSRIPGGEAGATAYLFKNSSLSKTSTVYSNGTSSFSAQATNNTSGSYYAAGYAMSSTSGGLIPHTVPATAEYGYRSVDPVFSEKEYAVNESGVEYGSLLSAESVGHEPDLVEAIATNGRPGYLHKADLEQPLNVSEEEAAWLAEHPTVDYITVYEVDGVTPVGVFELVYEPAE